MAVGEGILLSLNPEPWIMKSNNVIQWMLDGIKTVAFRGVVSGSGNRSNCSILSSLLQLHPDHQTQGCSVEVNIG